MGKRGPQRTAELAIDMDRLRELAFDGCSVPDMAALLGVPHATFDNVVGREPVRSILLQERARRRHHIYKMQRSIADSGGPGCAALAIWLGKQELGQHEPVTRHEVAASVDVGEDSLGDRLAALARARRTNGHDREAHINGADEA